MLNENFYNTTSNLSSACRTLAVAILGAILGLVWSDNLELNLLNFLPLGGYFCIDILQYLVCLIYIHRLDVLHYTLAISNETVQEKMLRLQKISLYFVYFKVLILIVAICFLLKYLL